MSRAGKQPIALPEGVEIEVGDFGVKAKGPKGELEREIPRQLELRVDGRMLLVEAKKRNKKARSLHGTFRALIANMVTGVSEGWSKSLELVGTGYRAQMEGNALILNVGFSHPVKFEAPEGISFKVEKAFVIVEGIDKEKVGEAAAKIRAIRPPEPYKGKGIRYQGEYVRRKPGKAAKAAGAPA